MRRKSLSILAMLLLLLTALIAVAAACGGGSSSNDTASTSPSQTPSLSAEEIVQQSDAKMADVNSLAFTVDFALGIKGDTSKMTDPTAKAMLSRGLTMRAEGKSSDKPVASTMQINLGLAGQNLDFGVAALKDKAWVQYQGKWYAVDQKNSKSLSTQAGKGGSPTEQLKSLGVDPEAWGATYELAGTEDMGGTQVYKITATADPKKLAASFLKTITDPGLADKLGDPATARQFEQGLAQSKAQIEAFAEGLKDASVTYYIGVDDMLIRKLVATATLSTKGQKDMQGVDSMTFDLTTTMSGFNEAVDVKPPANAQSIDQLMQQMFGGMDVGSF